LRIEGFDISNISGQEATGSMVSFYKGVPDKSQYRRFRIKTVTRTDDYAMMREVVRRRYSRLAASGAAMPDLVLIDGGKQHLRAAQEELERLGLDLQLMSIAKRTRTCIVKRCRPRSACARSPALNLNPQGQDEAHRFARATIIFCIKKRCCRTGMI
jgi:excinuclease ABC subunit C